VSEQGPSILLPPGTVLGGKLRIERVIGRGGMGVVYEATDQRLGRRVAIKLLAAPPETEEQARRFDREARAAASLTSDHVVRVLEVGTHDGVPYIVMELLEGRTLEAAIDAEGPLAAPLAVEWLLQALDAIGEAHERGLVHRDIKPANLFLADPGRAGAPIVKVLDFGVVKEVDANQARLTQTGTSMGTPAYMAPEQIRAAKAVDARADVWSLGATLHEMLTGSLPFQATSLPKLLAQILREPPAPLQSARGELPPALEPIVRRCLSKDPAKRYADADELADALEAATDGPRGTLRFGRRRRPLTDTDPDLDLDPRAKPTHTTAPPLALGTTEGTAGRRGAEPDPARVERTVRRRAPPPPPATGLRGAKLFMTSALGALAVGVAIVAAVMGRLGHGRTTATAAATVPSLEPPEASAATVPSASSVEDATGAGPTADPTADPPDASLTAEPSGATGPALRSRLGQVDGGPIPARSASASNNGTETILTDGGIVTRTSYARSVVPDLPPQPRHRASVETRFLGAQAKSWVAGMIPELEACGNPMPPCNSAIMFFDKSSPTVRWKEVAFDRLAFPGQRHCDAQMTTECAHKVVQRHAPAPVDCGGAPDCEAWVRVSWF